MIIEIALGIVLAVLILMFFDVILGLALIAVAIAVALAVLAVAVYFAFTEPIASGVIAGIAALIWGVVYWDEKRGHKKPSPLDPTASPTSIRLRQDDTEREHAARSSKTANQSAGTLIKALWLSRGPDFIKGTISLGVLLVALLAACLLAALTWQLTYGATSDGVAFLLTAVVFWAFLFGTLLVLDWIRAQKKKTPPSQTSGVPD